MLPRNPLRFVAGPVGFVNQDLMKSTCTDGLLKRFHQIQDAIDWANTKENPS